MYCRPLGVSLRCLPKVINIIAKKRLHLHPAICPVFLYIHIESVIVGFNIFTFCGIEHSVVTIGIITNHCVVDSYTPVRVHALDC